MDDRKLNLAMAKVCEIPVHRSRIGETDRYPEYPAIHRTVVTQEQLILYATVESPGVFWNPVGNFQQVCEFVLPALEAAGFDWLMRHEGDYPAEVEVYAGNPIAVYATRTAGSETTLCRCICEAAYEAWQLKEKS